MRYRLMLISLSMLGHSALGVASPLTILVSDNELPLTARSTVTLHQPRALPLSQISTDAKPHQVDLFETVVDVSFELELTVGDAMHRVLSVIGYDLLVAGVSVDPLAESLFARPLPVVHTTFEHTTIKAVLTALVGRGYHGCRRSHDSRSDGRLRAANEPLPSRGQQALAMKSMIVIASVSTLLCGCQWLPTQSSERLPACPGHMQFAERDLSGAQRFERHRTVYLLESGELCQR